MITSEKVSVELLNDVLAAYMNTAFDEDGDLMVNGGLPGIRNYYPGQVIHQADDYFSVK